ncbi:MAG: AAA family ATPase [Holosporaceae bacterium]|jgi:pilus assembly protein CpaE|nr:AAA family ATPase [Holosporaceae bacterium]
MANTNADLPHNLMGLVNDPVSEQIILDVIKDMGMAYSEAKQGRISDVIDFLKNNRTPKVLMVDISDSELPLSDIIKIKELGTPNMNIVVIGSRNEVGLFRDLIALGVSDYIVKPLGVSLLKQTLEEALKGKKLVTEKTGKMIQVISSVGGAGATTTAVNVGWLLANRHFKRAVIMDVDFLYGTANLMLDIRAENAYLDILESPDKIDDYFVETILKKYDQRLYYLGGLVDLVRGVHVDLNTFDALIGMVKKQFNYILIDSQRDISETNKVAMGKTDIFIIMVEMSFTSAQNTVRLMDFLNVTQPGKKIIIVANKVGLSRSGALSEESFERVIDSKIDYIMPLDEQITLAAANIGQPLALSNCPITDTLEFIAEDILGKKDNQHIEEAILKQTQTPMDKVKGTFFSFLKKAENFMKT